jgi:hypothetical protein
MPRAQKPVTSSFKKKSKSLRRGNRHPVAIGLVVATMVLGFSVYFIVAPAIRQPPFPYIAGESFIHVHPYLQIWINGQNVTIPAGIGIQDPTTSNGFTSSSMGNYEPIHTHDSSGILHVELSSTDAHVHNYTLGDFFAIWAWSSSHVNFNGTSHPVIFNQNDILGYVSDPTHKVVLLVDGVQSSAWGSLEIENLAFCGSNNGNLAPCTPTAGQGIYWGGSSTAYPYGTGHRIIIEYIHA